MVLPLDFHQTTLF